MPTAALSTPPASAAAIDDTSEPTEAAPTVETVAADQIVDTDETLEIEVISADAIETVVADRPADATELVATVVDGEGRPEIVVIEAHGSEPSVRAAVDELSQASSSEPVSLTALEWDQTWDLLEVSDPLRSEQWALDTLGAEGLWTSSDGSGVTVAVIDSGVAPHPDLAGHLVGGFDFVDDRPLSPTDTLDTHGHGTHVAGIIAATARNGFGIHGVTPGASVMPLRVMTGTEGARWSDIAAAIRFATDNGAQVINLSLGGSTESTVVREAIDDALSRGVTVVAAAGNTGADAQPVYPAAYPTAIGVAALDSQRNWASFSSVGSWVEVSAPGVSILSTVPADAFGLKSGTSMAAPHVSGLAAALRSLHRDTDPATLRAAIDTGAVDVATPGWDPSTGHGLIDFARSFEVLASTDAPSAPAPAPGAPRRLVDTRDTTQLTPGTTLRVAVPAGTTRMAGGPAILNVTAVHPQEAGFVTVWDCAGTPPTSNLNFAADETRANLVVTGTDADGSVCVTSSVTTDILVDSAGTVPFGSDFRPVGPQRLLDTRATTRAIAGSVVQVDLRPLLAAGDSAAVLNVTAVNPDEAGYLSVTPCGTGHDTSTVNFGAGRTVAAGTIVGAGDGILCVYTSATTDILVDISGMTGATTVGHRPQRILDTRNGRGMLSAGEVISLDVTTGTGLPATEAVAATITAVEPTEAGFLTVWDCGAEPTTSSLNHPVGGAVANAVISAVSGDQRLCIRASAPTHVLVDLTGRAG